MELVSLQEHQAWDKSPVGLRDETMALRAYSTVLWRERDLMDMLRYRLEVQELIVQAGRTSNLTLAVKEVEAALSNIRLAELERSMEAEETARSLGLAPDATLHEIAQAAPEPWGELLNEHRTALLELAGEISVLSKRNRDVLAACYQATQETLAILRADARTYDKHGAKDQPSGSHIIDTSL